VLGISKEMEDKNGIGSDASPESTSRSQNDI
jgi:hypothetical protein